MYSFRNNWQSCNKKKKKEGNPTSPSPLWEWAWLAACGSEHSAAASSAREQLLYHALQVTSGIWELGEKLTKQIKKRRDIERCSVSPSVNTMWASLKSWINYRLLQPQKCTKSFGEISLWEERNKAFLTDKGHYNSTKLYHTLYEWLDEKLKFSPLEEYIWHKHKCPINRWIQIPAFHLCPCKDIIWCSLFWIL